MKITVEVNDKKKWNFFIDESIVKFFEAGALIVFELNNKGELKAKRKDEN